MPLNGPQVRDTRPYHIVGSYRTFVKGQSVWPERRAATDVKTQMRKRAEMTRMKANWDPAGDGAREEWYKLVDEFDGHEYHEGGFIVVVTVRSTFRLDSDLSLDFDQGTSLESLWRNELPEQKMGSDLVDAGTESHSWTYQQREGGRPPSRQDPSTRRPSVQLRHPWHCSSKTASGSWRRPKPRRSTESKGSGLADEGYGVELHAEAAIHGQKRCRSFRLHLRGRRSAETWCQTIKEVSLVEKPEDGKGG